MQLLLVLHLFTCGPYLVLGVLLGTGLMDGTIDIRPEDTTSAWATLAGMILVWLADIPLTRWAKRRGWGLEFDESADWKVLFTSAPAIFLIGAPVSVVVGFFGMVVALW